MDHKPLFFDNASLFLIKYSFILCSTAVKWIDNNLPLLKEGPIQLHESTLQARSLGYLS